ncbi:hypothetical protein [Streptomyces sp. NPDC000229]|uniref:hypothetical protein n=1 Tax=Streptomyces sp. NPDC000229 TaxID=3154247 RepID=UPI003318C0A2
MTAGPPEQPLIPPPPPTVTALRQAVAQIAPAALPAFTREVDQAADQARLGSDLAPLRRFTAHWAVYVQIQRQPRPAARLRGARAQTRPAKKARKFFAPGVDPGPARST